MSEPEEQWQTTGASPVESSALFGIVLMQSQKSPAHSVANRRDGRPCHRASDPKTLCALCGKTKRLNRKERKDRKEGTTTKPLSLNSNLRTAPNDKADSPAEKP